MTREYRNRLFRQAASAITLALAAVFLPLQTTSQTAQAKTTSSAPGAGSGPRFVQPVSFVEPVNILPSFDFIAAPKADQEKENLSNKVHVLLSGESVSTGDGGEIRVAYLTSKDLPIRKFLKKLGVAASERKKAARKIAAQLGRRSRLKAGHPFGVVVGPKGEVQEIFYRPTNRSTRLYSVYLSHSPKESPLSPEIKAEKKRAGRIKSGEMAISYRTKETVYVGTIDPSHNFYRSVLREKGTASLAMQIQAVFSDVVDLSKMSPEDSFKIRVADKIAPDGNKLDGGVLLAAEVTIGGKSYKAVRMPVVGNKVFDYFDENGKPLRRPRDFCPESRITGAFGEWRQFGAHGPHRHEGVDKANRPGTSVTAPFSGVLSYVGDNGNGYDYHLRLKIGENEEVVLAHLMPGSVKRGGKPLRVGDVVEAGEAIAAIGAAVYPSTGAHCHGERRQSGVAVNPFADRLPQRGASLASLQRKWRMTEAMASARLAEKAQRQLAEVEKAVQQELAPKGFGDEMAQYMRTVSGCGVFPEPTSPAVRLVKALPIADLLGEARASGWLEGEQGASLRRSAAPLAQQNYGKAKAFMAERSAGEGYNPPLFFSNFIVQKQPSPTREPLTAYEALTAELDVPVMALTRRLRHYTPA